MASLVANNFKELLLYGIPNLNTDTCNIILMEPGFSFSRTAHEEYADVSPFELPTAFGYTAGGQALAGIVITNDAVLNAGIASWNNAAWAIAGGDLQADGAIVYDVTVVAPDNQPVIGFIDFGGTLTTYNGGTFTVANIAFAIT